MKINEYKDARYWQQERTKQGVGAKHYALAVATVMLIAFAELMKFAIFMEN